MSPLHLHCGGMQRLSISILQSMRKNVRLAQPNNKWPSVSQLMGTILVRSPFHSMCVALVQLNKGVNTAIISYVRDANVTSICDKCVQWGSCSRREYICEWWTCNMLILDNCGNMTHSCTPSSDCIVVLDKLNSVRQGANLESNWRVPVPKAKAWEKRGWRCCCDTQRRAR